MKLYEITSDLLALENLLDGLVDENGEPREPTAEELDTMGKWFQLSEEAFKQKFESYCKFIKNQKISADYADAERKTYKTELDRLSKRAKAYTNRAESLKALLWENMQRLHLTEYKTPLFSAKEQQTQISVTPLAGDNLKDVPEEFLKPRELDTLAIKAAIKAGELVCGKDDGTDVQAELNRFKLYWADTGKELKGVRWSQGSALYIR